MRLHMRKFLLLLIVGFGSISFWTLFTSYSSPVISAPVSEKPKTAPLAIAKQRRRKIDNKNSVFSNEVLNLPASKRFRPITCSINGEYNINCLKLVTSKEASVYIPFTFIRKYFDINGKITRSKNQEEYFEWSHSYSRIFYPDQPYDCKGKFLWFENYNVELRDRVKSVSATENVPISSQWYKNGHLYPTQIAQYGLSYYSKNISNPNSKIITLFANGSISNDFLKVPLFKLELLDDYLQFKDETFQLKCQPSHLIFDLEFQATKPGSVVFYLKNEEEDEYSVSYGTYNEEEHLQENVTVNYKIGTKPLNGEWFKLIRDSFVDVYKLYQLSSRKRGFYCLNRIEFNGEFKIRNLSLKTVDHAYFAKAAADWLLANQNTLGGWDIKVKRKLSGGSLVLNEGWHSAMAQGHALSLLTRVYHQTGKKDYLEAAKKAIKLFDIESFEKGVKATFFDKYVWYEEYPTVPSIFVLNGFIYSLFGLYDLSTSCDDQQCQYSQKLFDEGIRSLEAILPMYDSGSGSFYDLRHLKLDIAPNVARWDYHSTHINQLLYLYTIVRKDIFQTTANRWIRYMKGYRAPHN